MKYVRVVGWRWRARDLQPVVDQFDNTAKKISSSVESPQRQTTKRGEKKGNLHNLNIIIFVSDVCPPIVRCSFLPFLFWTSHKNW